MVDLLGVRALVDGVTDPLQRRGFVRRPAFLGSVAPDEEPGDSGRMVASWRRDRTLAHPRGSDAHHDVIASGLDADWVSVWDGGRFHIQVGGMVLDLLWRRTPLDGDEFGYVIEQLVTAVDRFAGP
jgi:hypothetical protein